jgi:pyruvate-formate lyase-activating enzyme
MVAIAGSKGSIEISDVELPAARPALAGKLLRGEVSINHILDYFRDNARLHELSVEVNMLCNLSCCYCYLAKRESKNTIPPRLWEERLFEAAMNGVSLIAIVGKEPFIDERGPKLLAFLDRVRREHRLNFRCGVVTNGTLLHRHIPTLTTISQIDYLDISLDAIGAKHDEVRGPGSFERAMRGFRAVRELSNVRALFVNSTLHTRNVEEVREFVFGMVERGVENLHFSPVLNFTDDRSLDGLLLSPRMVRRVTEELMELSDEVPGQVIFELPIEYVWRFLGDGVFEAEDIEEDVNGVLFVRPDRNSRFFFKTGVFPGYFWSNARITHEGLFLSELDTVAWASPEYAIGSIVHQSIPDLFRTARQKGKWFERFFRFTLNRLLHIALQEGLSASDFPAPDAWRRESLTPSLLPAVQ